MSVESMTMVMIAGPEKMGNTAIENLVVNREFHPENTIKTLAEVEKLLPLDASNPYADQLAKVCELARSLDIELNYRDFTEAELELSSVSGYISGISAHIAEIDTELVEKSKVIEGKTAAIKQLSHYESFDVVLKSLFTMRYQKFRFGRIPIAMFKKCFEIIKARPDVFFIESGRSGRWVYGAYFALPADFKATYELLEKMGFERVRIDVDGDIESSVEQVYKRLKDEVQEADQRIEVLEEERETIKNAEQEKLLLCYSWLRFMSDSINTNTCAGRREGRFYLLGWIPTDKQEEYAKECESYSGFGCFLTPSDEMKTIDPPVKLKKGFFSSIYEPFVEMFGLPGKGEIDPRLFMAFTYTLLFGIMFGDVGQGLVLVVLGLLLWRLKDLSLGRIIALCGLSATAFGFVYGSIFGSEEIIDGFKVLEGNNTMSILMITVGVGMVLISVCMVLNMITGVRQKDVKKIFFSPNGLAGLVMYDGLAGGMMLQIVKGTNVFTTPFILVAIVLPLLLIFAGAPLSKLLTHQEDWKPESVGMFFVEGFFELFETMLAYLSNTLSFLRVGAFAISHAGMMMVVYLLSQGADGGYSIGGLIFGNILITGLEAVLVCIQVMRLHYYEMFGRFYESGGVKFSPKTINYKAAD